MPRVAAVAAGNADTARAAATVLRAGGNAVDAVVAAGFAASVAEPGLSSLGGGGFLLWAPAGGPERLLDFFTDAPGRGRAPGFRAPPLPITVRFSGVDQVFHAGWGSVAVPGCLAGYLRPVRAHRRLPLAPVVAPA
ncbi:MAG: gamma-glutamyltransferase family protein, partial [Frankiaceae bacterium]|nr:gamma-glutamyltransferase family protein [Frankiaceae bacterium]